MSFAKAFLRFLSTPSARRATLTQRLGELASQFLSTPSARRATNPSRSCKLPTTNFYPRPPRGGRPAGRQRHGRPIPISIHALREEGDFVVRSTVFPLMQFLSTPSARRATRFSSSVGDYIRISIHALREEGDTSFLVVWGHLEISIHALREEGDKLFFLSSAEVGGFLSTPSARRATKGIHAALHDVQISIHALREEGDIATFTALRWISNFYPRPPRGGRLDFSLLVHRHGLFLSTPSARRATGPSRSFLPGCRYFYPRPPRGGRPCSRSA